MTIRSSTTTGALAAALVLAATGVALASPQAPGGAAAPAGAAPGAAAPFDAGRLADEALTGLRGSMKLTDDQIARIRPLLIDNMTTLRQVLIAYSNPNGWMFPALIQQFRGTREKFREEMVPILTPDQMKKFMEIRKEVDRELRDAICDARLEEVKPRLSLRPDQEKPVRSILCEDFEKKRDLVASMPATADQAASGQAAGQPAAATVQAIQGDTEARLRQVLAPDQMKAYEAYRDEMKAKARQNS